MPNRLGSKNRREFIVDTMEIQSLVERIRSIFRVELSGGYPERRTKGPVGSGKWVASPNSQIGQSPTRLEHERFPSNEKLHFLSS